MSNSFCRPGKAEGSPLAFKQRLKDPSGKEKFFIGERGVPLKKLRYW